MSNGYFTSESKQVPYSGRHRYWRIVVYETKLCGNFYAGLNELQFFSEKLGINQIPNNVVLSTRNPSDPNRPGGNANESFIDAAFDGHLYDFGTSAEQGRFPEFNPFRFYWSHPPFYTGAVQNNNDEYQSQAGQFNLTWLGQDFGNPVTVRSLAISTLATGGDYQSSPTKFDLQYSDDNESWSVLQSFSYYDWGPERTVVFNVDVTTTVLSEVFVPESRLRDYLSYIPPLHAPDPYFRAEVNFAVENARQLQLIAGATGSTYYDVDDAVGVQLDKVGERVGIARSVPVPIVHVFFTFGDARRGFGLGVWQHGTVVTTYGLQSFDDDTFRRLIKAKVIANAGDGSVTAAQSILSTFFADTDYLYSVIATDHGASNMDRCGAVMTVGFSGVLPPLLYMIAIEREILPIRAAGVKLKVLGTTVPGLPCFGFGVQNAYIGGFGLRKQEAFTLSKADVGLGFGQGYWNGAYLNSYTNRAAWARKPEYLADQGIVS